MKYWFIVCLNYSVIFVLTLAINDQVWNSFKFEFNKTYTNKIDATKRFFIFYNTCYSNSFKYILIKKGD